MDSHALINASVPGVNALQDAAAPKARGTSSGRGRRTARTGRHGIRRVAGRRVGMDMGAAALAARGVSSRARDLWVMLLVALVATMAAITGGVQTASAAGTSYDDHVLTTTTPANTTINLFDYWVGDAANDASQTATAPDTGINHRVENGVSTDHPLKFNEGDKGYDFNQWTGSGNGPYQGIVQNLLGSDGYPVLSDAVINTIVSGGATNYDTSLAYLFDETNYADGTQQGKAVYTGVQNLFQIKNGYYVYNSHDNFASYDAATNSFKVYDAPGVYHETSYKRGQFFPFNVASDVFTIGRSGKLGYNTDAVDSSNTKLNHHFGLSMTSEFTQPKNGQINGSDMVFDFIGDDDVWLYIDGVLVGDVGGVHDACGLSVNFATGKVTITNGSGVLDPSTSATTYKTTTLRALYEAALGEDAAAQYFDDGSDTFKSNTQHEMKFFFLERGAGSSNLQLMTNLYTAPSSDVTKYDQNNSPVSGATFALYRADESYAVQGDAIATGTTDANGKLTLQDADGNVISFDEAAAGTTHFVLREVAVPSGYRTSLYNTTGSSSGNKELHLEYIEVADSNGGVLVSPNETVTDASGNLIEVSCQWLNGGYLATMERIVAPETLTLSDGSTVVSSTATGTLFAVVFTQTDSGVWQPVVGTSTMGYQILGSTDLAGAVAAAQATAGGTPGAYGFVTDSSTGKIATNITSMPGDVRTYDGMTTTDAAKYKVDLYYTTATTLAGATEDNTLSVERVGFDSHFSTSLRITNVQNRLWVQKVDEAGNTVDGAQFSLYAASSLNFDADGNVTGVKSDADPVDTGTTSSTHSLYNLPGSVCFPVEGDKGSALTEGVYYLKETKAPAGYTVSDQWVKVVVQEDGVYADAGEEDDGVWTLAGPGSLVSLLNEFGSNDDIDNTLTLIKGNKQSGALSEDGTQVVWDAASAAEGTETMTMHMQYSSQADGAVLQYVTQDGEFPIMVFDTGWNRMALFQDGAPSKGANLSDLQVNQLFTSSVGVRIQDSRVPSVEVSKEVEDLDAAYDDATKQAIADAEFFFQLTLKDSSGAEFSTDKTYGASIYKSTVTTGEDGAEVTTEELVGDLTVKTGDIVALKADERLRVYGLETGTQCTVTELNYDTHLTTAERAALEGTSASVASEDDADAVDGASGTEGDAGTRGATGTGDAAGDTGDAAAGEVGDSIVRPSAEGRVVTQEYADAHATKGFHLTKRTYLNGTAYPNTEQSDDSMTCIVRPIEDATSVNPYCQLVFTNGYEPTAAALDTTGKQFLASKTFTSHDPARTWTEDDVFAIRLTALPGDDNTTYAPMPDGAVTAGGAAPYIEATVNGATESAVADDPEGTKSVLFGNISYSKPGTYAYHVTETKGSIAGVAYSFAQYRVTVTVANETQAVDGKEVPTGRLVVKSVTYTKEKDEIGKDVAGDSDDAKAELAAFTNVYDEAEEVIQPAATKKYEGDDTLTKGAFFFTLTAVGGKDTTAGPGGASIAWSFASLDDLKTLTDVTRGNVPMPASDAVDALSATASNDAVTADNQAPVLFGAITYAVANGDLGANGLGRTYVYEMVEVNGDRASVTYDDAKYYLVVTCSPKGAGIAVSAAYYKVDAATGAVSALGTQDDGQPVTPMFTNTYNTTPATAHIKAYKNLVGRAWNRFVVNEQYGFILTADEATAQAIEDGAITGLPMSWDATTRQVEKYASYMTYGSDAGLEDGTEVYYVDGEKKTKDSREVWFEQVTGAGLTFNKKGTYTFYIAEDATNPYAGVTYDAHRWTVTVKVTDADDDGVYEAAVSYGNGDATPTTSTERAEFINTYQADGYYAGINVAKTIQGREASQDEFTFAITPLTYDGAVISALRGTVTSGDAFTGTKEWLTRADAAGKIPLKGELATSSLDRTLLFRIQENVPSGDGVTQDEDGRTVKDGTTYDVRYTGAAYVLVEVKSLADVTGKLSDADKVYAVTTVLKGAGIDEAVAAAGLTDESDWKDVFSAENIAAYQQDTRNSVTEYSQLKADNTVDTTVAGRVAFANVYTSSLDYTAQGGLSIAKALNGEGGTPNASFTFRVTAIDATGTSAASATETANRLFDKAVSQDISVSAKGYGTFTQQLLSNITFNQDDNSKIYAFTVQELAPTDATENADGTVTKNGMTYDAQTVYTVRISISDDGKGNLTAVTLVTDQKGSVRRYVCSTSQAGTAAQLAFTNTYDAQPVAWTPTVIKRIAGMESTTDAFTFEMGTGDEGTDAALESGAIESGLQKIAVSEDSDVYQWIEQVTTGGATITQGTYGCPVSFGQVTFKQPGIYSFMVYEVAPEDEGDWNWDFSGATYIYTVTVTDNGKGALTAVYTVSGYDKDGFVSQDENGNTVIPARAVFLNTNGAVSGYAGVEIVKELSGKALKAGLFQFDIEPQDTVVGGVTVVTADEARAAMGADPDFNPKNGVDPVTCLTATFSAEDDNGKVYTYKVSEDPGAGSGYTYDDSYYIVTVAPTSTTAGSLDVTTTVTKYTRNEDGSYTAGEPVTTVDKGGVVASDRPTLTFSNAFKATGTLKGGTASIDATKTISGRTMAAGEFKFNLDLVYTDADGVDQTIALNAQGANLAPDADGVAKISFPDVRFTVGYGLPAGTTTLEEAVKSGTLPLDLLYEAGMAAYDVETDTYTVGLKVYEDKASLPDGVTPVPSDAVEQVTIKVTDDPSGELNARIVYRDGEESIAFENNYTPAKTVSATSGTGADKVTVTDADGRQVGVGDTLTYNINWVNNSSQDGVPVAGVVTVTDELPAGLDADSVEVPQPTGVACTVTKTQDAQTGRVTVVWTLGTEANPVAANASGTVTVSAKVSADVAKLVNASGMAQVDNSATIALPDGSSYTGTTTNYVPAKTSTVVPDESSVSDAAEANGEAVRQSGETVQVGQCLTFTITCMNTQDGSATVVVRDGVPAGTVFVEGSAGTDADGNAIAPDADGVITWTLADVPSGAVRTVSFTVRVTEDALATGGVTNSATVQVGDNPQITTTPTSNRVRTGALRLSKTVTTDGSATAPAAVFTFVITMTDASGDPLTGAYPISGRVNGQPLDPTAKLDFGTTASYLPEGSALVVLAANDYVVVGGLPEGAQYTIVESSSSSSSSSSSLAGFTPTYANCEGAIQASEVAGTTVASVLNTYAAQPSDALVGFAVKKVLAGRAWQDDETFTFSLTASSSNPDPEALPEGGATITLSKPEGAAQDTADETVTTTATGSFGGIVFKKAGTYVYTIRETGTSSDAYLTYSQAEYQVRVTVTNDVASNKLVVSGVSATQVKNREGVAVSVPTALDNMHFTNVYHRTSTDEKHVSKALGVYADGEAVSVGDVLTYTIKWTNDAVDATGAASKANVTVTDTLPAGVAFVEGSAGTDADGTAVAPDADGVITWNLGERGAHESGTLTFSVRVLESAFVDADGAAVDASGTPGQLENNAAVTLTNGSRTHTTPVSASNTLGTGSVAVSKEVSLTEGATEEEMAAAAEQEFTFTIDLNAFKRNDDGSQATDASGAVVYEPLAGEYAYAVYQKGDDDTYDETPVATGAVTHHGTLTLKAGQKAVVSGLPDGTVYGVAENAVAGYSPNSPVNATGTIEAAVAAKKDVQVAYVNTNRAVHTPEVAKVLAGDGAPALADGAFSFTMTVTAEEGGPADGFVIEGEDAGTNTSQATNDADGDVQFANIYFTQAGRYRVTVREDVPEVGDAGYDPLVTYDTHAYSYVVKVEAVEGAAGRFAVEIDHDSETGQVRTFTNTWNGQQKKTVDLTPATGSATITDASGKQIGVGDKLTYRIQWVNSAVDGNGRAAAADQVVVTDTVPAGVTLDTSWLTSTMAGLTKDGTGYKDADGNHVEVTTDKATRTITWTITGKDGAQVAAGARGTLAFQVTVDADAAQKANSSGDIANQATVTIGGNAQATNWVTNPVAKKTLLTPTADGIKVGDVVTYSITAENGDADGTRVVIDDTLSQGLEFVGSDADDNLTGNTVNADGTTTLQWVFESTQKGWSRTVTYRVRVTEAALAAGGTDATEIPNTATVTVGNNPSVTNTVNVPKPLTGTLDLYKYAYSLVEGMGEVTEFTFNVKAWYVNAQGEEVPLTGTYEADDPFGGYEGGPLAFDENGTAQVKLTCDVGGLNAVTFVGLPEGACFEVTEEPLDGWQEGDGQTTVSGTIGSFDSFAWFTNEFTPASTDPFHFTVGKKLVGRDAQKEESYAFALTSIDGAPMPDDATDADGDGALTSTVTVNLDAAEEGATVIGAFGDISYDDMGTYSYWVTESVSGTDPLTTYSRAQYRVDVVVGAARTYDESMEMWIVSATKLAVHSCTWTQVLDDEGNAIAEKDQVSIVVYRLGDGAMDSYVWDPDESLDIDVREGEGATPPVFTNTYEAPAPTKEVFDENAADPTVQWNGKAVKVGDVLTYEITWDNTAVDATGAATSATVTVRDTVPAGTAYVEGSAQFKGDAPEGASINESESDDGVVTSVTWTIPDADRAASGTVSFQVRVTEAVLGQLDRDGKPRVVNTDASVAINDGPATYVQPGTTNLVETGALSITKRLRNGSSGVPGSLIPKDRYFTFNVTLTDAQGTPLTGTYACTITESADARGSEADGSGRDTVGDDSAEGTVWLVLDEQGQGNLYLQGGQTVTVEGLPAGARYTVSEVAAAGWTQISPVDDEGNAVGVEGAIETGETADETFANAYTPQDAVLSDTAVLGVGKLLTGRAWGEDETFSFTLAPLDNTASLPVASMPLPEGAQDGAATAVLDKDGTTGTFGDLTFTRAGTYRYTVTEVTGGKANLTYSQAQYGVAITVGLDAANNRLVVTSCLMVQMRDDGGAAVYRPVTAGEDGKTLTAGFTNTYAEPVPVKTVTDADASGAQADADGKLVGVGDTLTYTVTWANTEVASDGAAGEVARVVVTDAVPAGTTYVPGSADLTVTSPEGAAVEWVLEESVDEDGAGAVSGLMWTITGADGAAVPAGASGTVSFRVTVGEGAAAVGTVENTAQVTVGDHDPKASNTVRSLVPAKTLAEQPAEGVQVGDVLTYQVTYANTEDAAAQVTVTDQLPVGLAYVDGSAKIDSRGPAEGEFSASGDGLLTWAMAEVPAGASGVVSFQARVTEAALVVDAANNTAGVQVGDNPSRATNTVRIPQLETGALAISKTVAAAEGIAVPDTEFTFTVVLTDGVDNVLSDSYAYYVTDENGAATVSVDGAQAGDGADGGDGDAAGGASESWDGGTIASGGTITLKAGQTAIITGLPAGTRYSVTEAAVEDFQQTAPLNDQGAATAASGTVTAAVDDQGAAVPARASFTNTYVKPTKTVTVPRSGGDAADADAATNPDASVQVGDELAYAVTFKNADGEGAGATVVDALPAGLAYVSGSAVVTVGGADAQAVEPEVASDARGAQTLTWQLADLPAGADVTVAFTARVTRDALLTVDNAATVNGHVSNTTTTPVEPDYAKHAYDAEGACIDGHAVGLGTRITYKIDWTNPADNPRTEDGKNLLTVTDVLPKGVEPDDDAIEDIEADGGTVTRSDDGVVTIVWKIWGAEAGQRGTVAFDAVVTADAFRGEGVDGVIELRNTATIAGGSISVDVHVDNYVDAGQAVVEKSVGGTLADGATPANATFGFQMVALAPYGDSGTLYPMGDYPYQLYDLATGEAIEGGTGTVTFEVVESDGEKFSLARFTLRGGQRMVISGMPAGATFAVVEDPDGLPQGWSVAEGSSEEVDDLTVTPGITDENTAHFANVYAAPVPTKSVDVTPASDPETTIADADGKLVSAGDVLTYKVAWTNFATDAEGNDIASDMVITDTVPTGTTLVPGSATFVDGDDGSGQVEVSEDGKTVTWTIPQAAAKARGTVSFQVTVDEPGADAETTYGAVENTARVSLVIGGNTATVDTNTVANPRPEKELVFGVGETGGVQVGDVLAYQVTFANNAGAGAPATVTDVLPVGLAYVDGTAQVNGADAAEGQFEATAYDATGAQPQQLTWTFAAQEGANTVSFQARVTEAALTAGTDNTASVQLGDDPSAKTNTVPSPQVETGSLTVTKNVQVMEGAGGAASGAYDEAFSFTLALRDAQGTPLTGTYAYTLTAADGTAAEGALTFVHDAAASADYGVATLSLKGGESVTVRGLPVGASYQVSEELTEDQATAGWEQDASTVSGTVTGGAEQASATFTNTLYGVDSEASVTVSATKTLLGRAQASGEFKFDVTTRGARAGDETVLHGFAGAAADGEAASVALTSDGVLTFDRAALAQAVAMGYATVDEATDEGIALQWTVSYTIAERVGEGDLPAGVEPTEGTPTSYDFAVCVADDGTGRLEACILGADGQPVAEGFAFAFSNTYMASGQIGAEGETSIAATKTLNGRAAQAGEFTFKVTDAADNLVASATNAASAEGEAGALTFSPIAYTLGQQDAGEGLAGTVVSDGFSSAALVDDGTGRRAATFAYTVSEVVFNLPGGVTAVAGKASYDVSVTVVDNGDGTLGVTVGYPEGTPGCGLDFENSYLKDGWATAALGGAKVVENLPEGTYLASGDYSFRLVPVADDGSEDETSDPHNPAQTTTVVADGGQGASGTFSFSLRYNTDDLAGVAAGEDGSRSRTFHYLLSEVVPSTGAVFGVTYDTTTYDVYVMLVDDGDGQLAADVSGVFEHESGEAVEAVAFTNVYDADEVTWAPTAWKTTAAPTGADLSGVTFSYLVTTPGADGSPVRVAGGTSGADGAISFDRFTVPGEGTFTYYLSELDSGASAPDAGGVDEATGAVKGGITYDDTYYLVQLTVTRSGNGTYDFEAHYYLNGDLGQEVWPGDGTQPGGVAFNNTYVSAGTSVQLYARKTVDGPHALDGFQFRVTDDATGAEVANGTSDADGNVVFGKIYYADAVPTTDASAVADASATTTDGDANGASGANGTEGTTTSGTVLEDGSVVNADGSVTHPDGSITYADGSVRRADGALVAPDGTVTLPDGTVVAPDSTDGGSESGDAGDGGEDADTEGGDGGDANGDFESGDAGEEASALAGETEAAEAVSEADAPEAASLLDMLDLGPSVAVADDADVQEFSTETVPAAAAYTAGVVEEHWYTISEVDTGLAGVTYDTTSWKVHVTVSDDGTGQLSAVVDSIVEVSVGEDGQVYQTERGTDQSVIVFENSYKASNPATLQLAGVKVLTGRAAQAGEFTFSVVDQATGEVVAGGKTTADGAAGEAVPVGFGTITYTEAGEYDYLVSEDRGGTTVAGVTYDAAVYAVHVSVTDQGDGNLAAQVTRVMAADGTDVTDAGANALRFTNAYATSGETSVTLEATKTLAGRDAKAGEFSFEVRDADGELVTAGTSAAAKDGEPAAVTFGQLHFSAAGDYAYTVREVHAGEKLAGVTYDTAVFTATVHVVDNGDGTLGVAGVDYAFADGSAVAGMAFANTYKADRPLSIMPNAGKALTGRALAAGEFSFEVRDADGTTVSCGLNDAAGNVKFDAITLGEAGVYEYTMVELAGDATGVTYDTTTYRMTVTVADNGDGTLSAKVAYTDASGNALVGATRPTFVNTYESSDPDPDPTPTPDPSPTPTPTPTPSPAPDPTPTPSDGGNGGGTDGGNGGASPKTGDASTDAAALVVAGVAGAAALAGGAALLLRRRREE